MILTSLVFRTPEFFTQVICHLTDWHCIFVLDIPSSVMSVPGVHSAAVLLLFFLFGGLTMALEVGILVDILSHFVPFSIFAQINWSAATPFHVLLFHPQYAFVAVCSSSGSREVGRRSVRCSSVGWCCLPAGMLLVQCAQGVTTPWNGCSLSKFNTFEVKDWLEATPFSEYS